MNPPLAAGLDASQHSPLGERVGKEERRAAATQLSRALPELGQPLLWKAPWYNTTPAWEKLSALTAPALRPP